MIQQIRGLFATPQEVWMAVQELREAGFADSQLSLIATQSAGPEQPDVWSERGDQFGTLEGASFGATSGAVMGGLAGLLIGAGVLALPGLGLVLASGTFASILATTAAGASLGAGTGGLIGALVAAGIPEETALLYSEDIREGRTLMIVHAQSDQQAGLASAILARHAPLSLDAGLSQPATAEPARLDYSSSMAGVDSASGEAVASPSDLEPLEPPRERSVGE